MKPRWNAVLLSLQIGAHVALFAVPAAAQDSTQLLPNTDCDSLQAAFESCASGELSSDELGTCNFCMARAVLSAPTGNCDSLSTNICTAIAQDCDCGTSCQQPLEALMDCGMQDIFGCSVSCDFATVSPSVAVMTTVAPTITSTDVNSSLNSQTQCSNAQDNIDSCFSAANMDATDIDACNACVAGAIPSPTSGCSTFESTVCDAIVSCPCGPCRPEVETLLNCAFEGSIGCTLGCDYSTTDAPAASAGTTQAPTADAAVAPSSATASAAPTPFVDCDTVQSALQECYTNNLHSSDSLSCDACIAGTIPGPDETDCSVFSDDLCPALSTCGCEPCGQAVENLLNCVFVNTNKCRLDCENQVVATPTPAPAKDTCNDARSSLRTCFDAELSLDEASACDSCVAGSFPSSFTNCDELVSDVCSGIQTCSCGSCASDVETFVSCSFESTTACVVDCAGEVTDSPTDSAAVTPTTSTSVPSEDISGSTRLPMITLAASMVPVATWLLL